MLFHLVAHWYKHSNTTIRSGMSLAIRLLTASFCAFFLAVSAVSSAPSDVELVMFERTGCPWCARWEQDVEPVYAKTEFGKVIPLRKVNLDREKAAGLILDLPVRFTPTFVVVRNGKEVGRITGYMNDAAFWGLFEMIAAQATRN